MTDQDTNLARFFEELRRADDARLPAYGEVVHRGRASRRRRTGWPVLAALAVLLILAAAGGLLSVRRKESAVMPDDLSGWRSPTEVLLATPGQELLTGLPEITSPRMLGSAVLFDTPRGGSTPPETTETPGKGDRS